MSTKLTFTKRELAELVEVFERLSEEDPSNSLHRTLEFKIRRAYHLVADFECEEIRRRVFAKERL